MAPPLYLEAEEFGYGPQNEPLLEILKRAIFRSIIWSNFDSPEGTVVLDKVVQVSEFKKNPSRFLEEVRRGTPITITQGRRADTIIVPRETWGQLLALLQELEEELETRELLADPKVQKRLGQGLPEHGVPLHEARAFLKARISR
jgi:prevent-host-death family protein